MCILLLTIHIMSFENINIPMEVIWVFALIFVVLSFFESDKKMFILLAIWSFFYFIHFLWLWLITLACINLIDILKNLVVIKYKKNELIFFIFILAYTIMWIFTAKMWVYSYNWVILSYLATLASITSLFAAFFLRWISFRIVYFVSIIILLIYTIVWNSLSWSITNILLLLTVTSSAYILYKRRWFWWKIRYAKFLFLKNLRKILWYRYGRVKFLW